MNAARSARPTQHNARDKPTDVARRRLHSGDHRGDGILRERRLDKALACDEVRRVHRYVLQASRVSNSRAGGQSQQGSQAASLLAADQAEPVVHSIKSRSPPAAVCRERPQLHQRGITESRRRRSLQAAPGPERNARTPVTWSSTSVVTLGHRHIACPAGPWPLGALTPYGHALVESLSRGSNLPDDDRVLADDRHSGRLAHEGRPLDGHDREPGARGRDSEVFADPVAKREVPRRPTRCSKPVRR